MPPFLFCGAFPVRHEQATLSAYAAVTAQAKLKREEQARQSSRQEIAHSVTEANVLTSELTDLLIEKVYVFPDNRIEIVYKVHDLFE